MENTLLGVDLLLNEEVVARDLSGLELEGFLADFSGEVVAILTPTGGQGSLLGRGNQQLTPSVLRRIGRDNLWVLATKAKMAALNARPLLIDTNDSQLDQCLSGYYRVITGYRDAIVYPASCGYGVAAERSGNTKNKSGKGEGPYPRCSEKVNGSFI